MKKQSSDSFTEMNAQHNENLSAVGNETSACGTTPPKNKIFTAAELWNIQNHSKRRIQRRFDF